MPAFKERHRPGNPGRGSMEACLWNEAHGRHCVKERTRLRRTGLEAARVPASGDANNWTARTRDRRTSASAPIACRKPRPAQLENQVVRPVWIPQIKTTPVRTGTGSIPARWSTPTLDKCH